jgi:uncharacterized protein
MESSSHLRRAAALAGLAAVLLASFGATPVAEAQQRVTLAMLEWPTGYGPPEQSVILGRLVTEGSERIRLQPQETPGYVYNIKAMARDDWRWPRHVFGYSSGAKWLSKEGIAPFFEEPIPEDWDNLWAEAIWLNGNFVTLDPEIRTPADFKGKRIALGLRSQTHWAGFPTVILEHGFGITPENTTIEYLGPRAAMDALLDGRVDAAVIGAVADIGFDVVIAGPTLLHLASSGRSFRYVDFGREAIEAVNEKTGSPFLVIELPAGKLPGQDQPLRLFADIGWKAAHPSFDEDVAYELTKAVIEQAPRVGEYFAFGELWGNPEFLVLGLDEGNTHPGAIRAYREAGLWDKRRASP